MTTHFRSMYGNTACGLCSDPPYALTRMPENVDCGNCLRTDTFKAAFK